jgi:hypothetical protein
MIYREEMPDGAKNCRNYGEIHLCCPFLFIGEYKLRICVVSFKLCTEAEFLDVIGTTVFRVFLLEFTVTSTNGFLSPSFFSKVF